MSRQTAQMPPTPAALPDWQWTGPVVHDALAWFYHERISIDAAQAQAIARLHAQIWWATLEGEPIDMRMDALRQLVVKAGMLATIIEEANAYILRDLVGIMRTARRNQSDELKRFEARAGALYEQLQAGMHKA